MEIKYVNDVFNGTVDGLYNYLIKQAAKWEDASPILETIKTLQQYVDNAKLYSLPAFIRWSTDDWILKDVDSFDVDEFEDYHVYEIKIINASGACIKEIKPDIVPNTFDIAKIKITRTQVAYVNIALPSKMDPADYDFEYEAESIIDGYEFDLLDLDEDDREYTFENTVETSCSYQYAYDNAYNNDDISEYDD